MVRVYNVMIRCPATNRPLMTGIQTTSPERFAREIYQSLPVECPHCHGEHRWNKEDAFLLAEDSVSESDKLWRPNQ